MNKISVSINILLLHVLKEPDYYNETAVDIRSVKQNVGRASQRKQIRHSSNFMVCLVTVMVKTAFVE
jgi:hypothetical protein